MCFLGFFSEEKGNRKELELWKEREEEARAKEKTKMRPRPTLVDLDLFLSSSLALSIFSLTFPEEENARTTGPSKCKVIQILSPLSNAKQFFFEKAKTTTERLAHQPFSSLILILPRGQAVPAGEAHGREHDEQ